MKKFIFIAFLGLFMTGCYNYNNIALLSHNDIAQEIIDALNAAGNNTNVLEELEMVPAHTIWEEYEYWDVSCHCYETAAREVFKPARYRDQYSGLSVEIQTRDSIKNGKQQPRLEDKLLSAKAISLADRFNIGIERSREIVRLSLAWERASQLSLSDNDQDFFAQKLLGFTMSDAKKAAQQSAIGNEALLKELIERAAETNATTPHTIKKIFASF